jgi:hypothetical protein
MDLPPHPQQDDDQESTTDVNWAAVIAVTIVAALFAALIILHLTGIVGPAGD